MLTTVTLSAIEDEVTSLESRLAVLYSELRGYETARWEAHSELRDYAGTLRLNVNALTAQAQMLAAQLERVFSFGPHS